VTRPPPGHPHYHNKPVGGAVTPELGNRGFGE